jgi:hypothetical protein
MNKVDQCWVKSIILIVLKPVPKSTWQKLLVVEESYVRSVNRSIITLGKSQR